MSPARTVLLIDDDPDIVHALRLCLERNGYQVAAAADGPTGVAQADAVHPGLVVVDLLLPGQNGFLVLERLKARGPEAPRVLMITASGGEPHRAYAELLGVDDYLVKPFSLEAFLEKVRRLLP